MNAMKKEITRSDILPYETYAAERKARRASITQLKKARRIAVGPYATFYFENYDTMFQQIHEMLHIERGGEDQIADELAAYNPLIPKGRELVATLMFEINDPALRDRELRRLTHVENEIYVDVGGQRIKAEPDGDVERTREDGKTSSVHFLHFQFTPDQVALFRDVAVPAMITITHEHYGHMAMIPKESRLALSRDFA